MPVSLADICQGEVEVRREAGAESINDLSWWRDHLCGHLGQLQACLGQKNNDLAFALTAVIS